MLKLAQLLAERPLHLFLGASACWVAFVAVPEFIGDVTKPGVARLVLCMVAAAFASVPAAMLLVARAGHDTPCFSQTKAPTWIR